MQTMHMLQQTKRALGCQTVLTLVGPSRHELDELLEKLWRKIDDFDLRFSRFITFSELSNFNLNAGKITKASPEFIDLLKASKAYGIKTSGRYNPFILPALQRAGYKGSWPNPDNVVAGLDFSSRQIALPEEIQVDNEVAKIPKNSAIDFGGIGKGYLLDELADFTEPKVHGYWLSLGGDIVAGGKDQNNKDWEIGIEAAEGNTPVSQYKVKSQRVAIATSGTTKRNGRFHQKAWHHLIDPVSGEPAKTDIATATVITQSATQADILASCLVLGGSIMAQKIADDFSDQFGDNDFNILLQLGVLTKNSRSLVKLNS